MLRAHRWGKPLLWRAWPALAGQGRGVKATTGIVGLEVDPQARATLAGKIAEVLEAVKVIPPEAGYREVVEEAFQHRQGVVASDLPDEEVEGQFDVQLEQMIKMCEDELSLIPKMAEWKPWEVPEGYTVKGVAEEQSPALPPT